MRGFFPINNRTRAGYVFRRCASLEWVKNAPITGRKTLRIMAETGRKCKRFPAGSRANASYFLTLFQFWLRFITPKSGVARNTACHRTPKWLARRPDALRPGGSVWSAVASGIPRDTAFSGFATHADPSQRRREPKQAKGA
jgi:hypothetical protein